MQTADLRANAATNELWFPFLLILLTQPKMSIYNLYSDKKVTFKNPYNSIILQHVTVGIFIMKYSETTIEQKELGELGLSKSHRTNRHHSTLTVGPNNGRTSVVNSLVTFTKPALGSSC